MVYSEQNLKNEQNIPEHDFFWLGGGAGRTTIRYLGSASGKDHSIYQILCEGATSATDRKRTSWLSVPRALVIVTTAPAEETTQECGKLILPETVQSIKFLKWKLNPDFQNQSC